MSYYDRTPRINEDGARGFATVQDDDDQAEVARVLEAAWSCRLRPFGYFSPIDYYAERDGTIVGLVEIKCRSHEAARYPDVFLNLRKWLALTLGESGVGVPGIFAVGFQDGVRFVRATEVAGAKVEMGGCLRRVKSTSDVEPVFRVPISLMQEIEA